MYIYIYIYIISSSQSQDDETVWLIYINIHTHMYTHILTIYYKLTRSANNVALAWLLLHELFQALQVELTFLVEFWTPTHWKKLKNEMEFTILILFSHSTMNQLIITLLFSIIPSSSYISRMFIPELSAFDLPNIAP